MRPIDADVLESSIQEQTGKCMIKIFDPSVNLILQDIRNAPTIDAEPVKHAQWEDVKFSEGVYKENDDSNDIGLSITSAKCSLCHRYSDMLQQYSPKMPAYCSHCGAKMDLKDGETK